MAAYQTGQVFTNLLWGTMPMGMLVGGQAVEARARGTCAVAVADPALLAAQLPDPEDLPGYVRSQFARAVNDLLGERSQQAADAAQFTAINPATYQAFRDEVEPQLAACGLQLKAMRIEAIEIV